MVARSRAGLTKRSIKKQSMQRTPLRFWQQGYWMLLLLLVSCGTQQQVQKIAQRQLAATDAFDKAHWGVSILDLATNRYWYNQNGHKYFVPASNTKIPTCYVAMRHLQDRLPAAVVRETADTLCSHGAIPVFCILTFQSSPCGNKCWPLRNMWSCTSRLVIALRPMVVVGLGMITKSHISPSEALFRSMETWFLSRSPINE
jgi:hypothetical protein